MEHQCPKSSKGEKEKLIKGVIHSDNNTAVGRVGAYKVLQELTAAVASDFLSSIDKIM